MAVGGHRSPPLSAAPGYPILAAPVVRSGLPARPAAAARRPRWFPPGPNPAQAPAEARSGVELASPDP